MIATHMPPRRASAEGAKVTVCGRVSPDVAQALKEIAEEMSRQAAPATVNMSQLVEYALTDFVAKRRGKSRSSK